MPGNTSKEGRKLAATRIYNVDMVVGLFTNSSGLNDDSVFADFVQPVGGGYAEVALPAGSFTISANGDVTLATPVDILATGAGFGPIYGAYIRSIDVTPEVLHWEIDPAAPVTKTDGQIYRVNMANLVA